MTTDPTSRRPDPNPAFCFGLSIPEIQISHPVAFFKSVSGLKSETEVTDYREGGVNGTTRRLVGAAKWPNLIFKRGFAGAAWELLAWRYAWLDDSRTSRTYRPKVRMTGSIYQLDRSYRITAEWKFHRAWPCKWDGPDYDASKSELAIESLEIAHEGLTFVSYENGRPGRVMGTAPPRLPDPPPPCPQCPGDLDKHDPGKYPVQPAAADERIAAAAAAAAGTPAAAAAHRRHHHHHRHRR